MSNTFGRFILVLLLLAAPLAGCGGKAPYQPGDGLELVILHTNDTHSHIAGIGEHGNASFDPATGRGGLGRIAAAINAAKAEKDNVIALDAGDQFQGTLFYSVNKWPLLAELDQFMPWDAMTLGNHEFDEGCLELARFIETLKIPVLAANLTPEKGCPLLKANTVDHIIKEVRGVKVGIIGIANDEVVTLASACPHTKFIEAKEALAQQVRALEAEGVKHIIAVTHIGLPADRELARSVDGVDVIVGGHTHSYLGEGSPEGPYPIVEHSPNGDPVLVVTAKNAAQYLGELKVSFDGSGVPTAWAGEAVELGRDMPSDPEIDQVIARYLKSLDAFRKEVVGSNSIDLPDGLDLCRENECLGGLLTADAMLEAGRATLPKGEISMGDILTVHPFGNTFVLREYSGEELWEALEHGVAEEGAKGPRLLQTAGLRYVVDGSRPAGSRIVKAEIIDANGKASPLKLKNRYGVALSSYIAGGGDGYAMLANGKAMPSPDSLIADVVADYIRKHSPLEQIETGRIVRAR